MKPGTRVRMSEELKRAFRGACRHRDASDAGGCIRCSTAHVLEFGGCVGTVEGQVTGPHGEVWPEVNVRWQPSGLRYAYHPNDLCEVA